MRMLVRDPTDAVRTYRLGGDCPFQNGRKPTFSWPKIATCRRGTCAKIRTARVFARAALTDLTLGRSPRALASWF